MAICRPLRHGQYVKHIIIWRHYVINRFSSVSIYYTSYTAGSIMPLYHVHFLSKGCDGYKLIHRTTCYIHFIFVNNIFLIIAITGVLVLFFFQVSMPLDEMFTWCGLPIPEVYKLINLTILNKMAVILCTVCCVQFTLDNIFCIYRIQNVISIQNGYVNCR